MAQGTCPVSGCDRKREGRKPYCRLHYQRVVTTGSLADPRSAVQRFWAKVNRNGPVPVHRPELGPCWLWTGALDAKGYAGIRVGDKKPRVHRFAWELLVGPVPEGLELDHLCFVRNCVHPAHLEPVTHRENTLRSHNPAALNARRKFCAKGHPLPPIGTVGRRCAPCTREYRRLYMRDRRRRLAFT